MSAIAIALSAVGALAGVFLLAVIVVAFIQALRDRKLDTLSQAAWLLFIVFVPVVGAVAWFLVDEHHAQAILNRLRWALPGNH